MSTPGHTASFPAWMSSIQQRTEHALDHCLPAASSLPGRLHDAMRYATLGGGKRVRALLVHAAGNCVGATPERLDALACAVEMIHAYSLIHDDLPCMDDDVLRRGKPTVHVEFDEATALLAGDALQTLAFQLIAAPGLLPQPAIQLELVALLAQASGSHGMVGGQAIDLASVGQAVSLEHLEQMHIRKTGALIRASVLLGAHGNGTPASDTLAALDRYAKTVGLLFQVVDDILDASADTATLGKTAGKDADHDKPTYVSLLGLAEARRHADELLAHALAPVTPLGGTQYLVELACFIAHRSF